MCLVHVLLIYYTQGVLKLKKLFRRQKVNISTGWRLSPQLHAQVDFLPKEHTAVTHWAEGAGWASDLDI